MLKSLEEDDLALVLEWRNAPEVRHNMYSTHEISAEEHRDWYASMVNDPSRLYFLYMDESEKCGVVYFTNLSVEKRIAFWGFYAGQTAAKGTGLKTEYDALEYAFEVLKLHKLNCEVISFNKSVINGHKKAGFSEEGHFRDHHFDGEEYYDVIRLGMLSSEWQVSKEKLANRIIKLSGKK
jgi:UDP-4-amino-4,6-dideoxy-N-acetyl-beta-L-altrosamine N-acetyltransferase